VLEKNCAAGYTFNCSLCNSSSFEIIGGLCLNPPYGYNANALKFPVTSAIFDSFQQFYGEIFQSGADSSTWAPFNNPDNDDPLPAKNRGLYFDGVHSFLYSGLLDSLNANFSLALWFYSTGNTVGVMCKESVIINANGTMGISLSNYSYTQTFLSNNSQTVALNQWIFLAFSVNLASTVTIITQNYNQAVSITLAVDNLPFYDSVAPTFLGHCSNSYYNGFLYSVFIWQTSITDFTSAYFICGGNQAASCLWNCSINYYEDASLCSNCDSSCTAGCVRNSDCRLCADSLCDICSDFTANSCISCTSNAQLSLLGVCNCSPGYYQVSHSCVKCDKTCASCYSSTYFSCLSCPDSKFLLTDICIDQCPVGFGLKNEICHIPTAERPTIQYIFNTISSVIRDAVSGIPALAGITTWDYPQIIPSSPIPSYQRGLYFTGNGSFMSLPSSNETFVLFGESFSFSLWINPVSSSANLLTYTQNSNMSFSIALSSLSATMDIVINSSQYTYTADSTLTSGIWSHLLFCLSYTNFSSITAYVNTLQSETTILSSEPFKDSLGLILYIGNSSDLFYNGFIYSFEIYAGMPSIRSLSVTGPCDSCPVCFPSGSCLPICNLTSFMDPESNTCLRCLSNCSNGCRDNSSCNICQDQHCKSCADYDQESCVDCDYGYVLNYIYNNKTCTRCTFKAYLTISSDDILIIVFEQALGTPLSDTDLNITINKVPANFIVQQIDDYSYLLNITYTISIRSDDKVHVKITKTLVSKIDSLLETTDLSIKLFPMISNSSENDIDNAIGYSKMCVLIVTTISLCCAGLSLSPGMFFTFLNAAEIYTYVLLYNTQLHPLLTTVLSSLQVNSAIPNIFSYFISSDQGNPIPVQFNNFSEVSDLIFLNSGSLLTLLLGLIAFWILIKCIPSIKLKFIKNKIEILKTNYKYQVFLRYYLQSYLELSLNSTIAIMNYQFKTYINAINTGIACLIMVSYK
jgi:hypothetical protein